MRGRLLTAIAIFMAGCAAVGERSKVANCVASGGQPVSLADMYPSFSHHPSDQRRVLCNRPTTDAGKLCTDRIGQCQSLCIAPPGASIGQAATGRCADHMLVPDGTLLVGHGQVLDPNVLQ
jgi:hypothetical protein